MDADVLPVSLARKMIVKLSPSPQRALKRGGYQHHHERGRVETYRDEALISYTTTRSFGFVSLCTTSP